MTLHDLHIHGANLATLIIARHLARTDRPLSIAEIESPADAQNTKRHLQILETLGAVRRVGIKPVPGVGRRPMLYEITETGRSQISKILTA